MVELRKRKAPMEATPPPIKKANSVKSTSSTKNETSTKGSTPSRKVADGDIIEFDGFGGEVETQEGVKTTLKELVEHSRNGVVLFTYPKASTPGCTTQACLFRDEYNSLTATGFSIYGLSTDSPKSNTNFKSKQNLPYTLLCDPGASLIKAIGMKKAPSGTIRGVFVVNKEGKVQAVSPGGPAATVDVVRKLIEASAGANDNVENVTKGENVEEGVEPGNTNAQETEQHNAGNGAQASAEVAAEVADTAEKLDNGATA